MTKEEILAMEAGKRLDWEVAQLMGVKTQIFEFAYEAGNYNYSSDISAAWEVEEALYAKTPDMGMRYAKELINLMGIRDDRRLSHLAKLIRATPEQRCKAALLAVINS